MAGLDPAVYQSGNMRARPDHKRGIVICGVIWLMTTKVIQYTISLTFLSQAKEGGFALQDGCV